MTAQSIGSLRFGVMMLMVIFSIWYGYKSAKNSRKKATKDKDWKPRPAKQYLVIAGFSFVLTALSIWRNALTPSVGDEFLAYFYLFFTIGELVAFYDIERSTAALAELKAKLRRFDTFQSDYAKFKATGNEGMWGGDAEV